MLDHRFPDAIVVNLNVVEGTRARAANQVACAEHCQRGKPIGAQACHAEGGGLAHGLAGNRDGLQEASRPARQAPDPVPQHFVESDLPRRRAGGRSGARRDVAHQLGDEKGITARLPGDRSGVGRHVRIASAEQAQRKLPRFRFRQCIDGQIAPIHDPILTLRLPEERPQERAAPRVFVTVAAQQQKHGRVGGPHELRKQSRAIGIAPLEVVDGQHQRASVAQPRQQFAQGDEGPPSQLSRVGDLDRTPRQRRHGLDPVQHRENLRERPDVAREYSLHCCGGQSPQMPAQGVDQAVQGLVGNRLLLVASPRQHHGRLTPDETRQEVLDQDSLSRPRAAVDVDGGRLPAAHRLERVIQDLEMPLPADERSSLTRQPSLRVGEVQLIRPVAQPTEYLTPCRSCVRIPS